MNSLEVMSQACAEALEATDDDPHWRGLYYSVVDPQSVLELIALASATESALPQEQLQALGKLVRDLTGYIKLHCGGKEDPVRDDLLLQAQQLLNETNL